MTGNRTTPSAASVETLAATVRDVLNDGPLAPHKTEAFVALASLVAVAARAEEAEASNAVFMSGEAYSRMHDAWHAETDRAEAAEARAAQLGAALRQAKRDIVSIHAAGFDSFRKELCEAAINRVRAALAAAPPADQETGT